MKLAAILFLCLTASAETHRSAKAVRDFRASHPCPATGKVEKACPGYVVDHIIPLCVCAHETRCLNTLDKPDNMQWQAVADAKRKDRIEVTACRNAAGKICTVQ